MRALKPDRQRKVMFWTEALSVWCAFCLNFSPSFIAHPSLSLFCPLHVPLPPSLPLECVEVIAPAEPQAVVATHWLLYLLIWPACPVYHDALKLCMGKITQTMEMVKKLVWDWTRTPTPGLEFIILVLRWKPDILSFFMLMKYSLLSNHCCNVLAFHPHRYNGNECLCSKIEVQNFVWKSTFLLQMYY